MIHKKGLTRAFLKSHRRNQYERFVSKTIIPHQESKLVLANNRKTLLTLRESWQQPPLAIQGVSSTHTTYFSTLFVQPHPSFQSQFLPENCYTLDFTVPTLYSRSISRKLGSNWQKFEDTQETVLHKNLLFIDLNGFLELFLVPEKIGPYLYWPFSSDWRLVRL